MTTQQLNEIRERCETATSAPWYIRRHTVEDYNANHICGDFGYGSVDDKAFIAHARADVPALLDEIERLNAALEQNGATRMNGTYIDMKTHTRVMCEVERLQKRERDFIEALKYNTRTCLCNLCLHQPCEFYPCKFEFCEERFGGESSD
jgi:putative IMPACT (imprinted ancient) family translation regulator